MKVVLINKTSLRPPAALVRRAINATTKKSGIVAVVLVNSREMQNLNRRTRGRDVPTDVLSFPQGKGTFQTPPGEPRDLGTIVINVDMLATNPRVNLAHHLIHGTLHLLGKHHGTCAEHKKLIALENRLLKQIVQSSHPSLPAGRQDILPSKRGGI